VYPGLKARAIFTRPLTRTITPSLTVGLLPRADADDHPPANAGGTDLALNVGRDARAPFYIAHAKYVVRLTYDLY